jgi:hypothetical protein
MSLIDLIISVLEEEVYMFYSASRGRLEEDFGAIGAEDGYR